MSLLDALIAAKLGGGGGGGGGGESTIAWKPTVAADGTISWSRTSSTTKPADQNIKGADGTDGIDGKDGVDGQDGTDGFSPTVTITPIQGGNRVTITDADGDHEFDVMNGSGGGDAVLTAALTASKTVGGISSGKNYAVNTPLETIFRDMLNPLENPSLTSPSLRLNVWEENGLIVEANSITERTIELLFDRGEISPPYGTSGFRSGPAISYSLSGFPEPQSSNIFTVTIDATNGAIFLYDGTVQYSAGEQPKNSAGEDYKTPLPAGSITKTIKFRAVSPLWSNAADITIIAKEALLARGAGGKRFDFPAQTTEHPEVFDIPMEFIPLLGIELLNTLTNQWVDCSGEFTISDVTHNNREYKRYTYNGVATGPRAVRVTWDPVEPN